jgi:hypothetical protein
MSARKRNGKGTDLGVVFDASMAMQAFREGNPEPLAERVESGNATPAELELAGAIIRGRVKREAHRPKKQATEEKGKRIALLVLRLVEAWDWPKDAAVAEAMKQHKVGRGTAYATVRKYRDDPFVRFVVANDKKFAPYVKEHWRLEALAEEMRQEQQHESS